MRKFFTLLELLVVVVILMILISMLLPAAMKGRESAQTVSCLSNLRQLGSAMLSYSDDWRGRLPPYVTSAKTADHPGLNWGYWSFPYFNDTRVLVCPVSPGKEPLPTKESLHVYDGHYGWNYDGTQGNRGALCNAIRFPSQGYLLCDSGDPCIIYGANTWDNLMEELDLDWDSKLEGANRHNQMANTLFVDDHAETRSLDQFLAAPCRSYEPPWYIPWEQGQLPLGIVPYPLR